MSAFKDAVARDVQNVFLNINEFADRHDVNGQELVCIVDKDITDPAKQSGSNPLTGVFVNSIAIYVKPHDLKQRPVEGELLYLDGKMYIVRSVSSEMGLLVIMAEVHDQ